VSTTAEQHENEQDERQSRTQSERAVSLGKYRVIAKLGTGGMAEVYLAVAQGAMNVNRLVVVKRLREEQAGDPSSRAMFLDEARLAARLNHPNVIQTFEAGTEGGMYFLAMEYVEGQPFSRVLTKLKQDGRRLSPKMAARICADALAGLHYAHTLADFDGTPLSIVHRDVSPQNMMITYGGVTKIVDFGIAKAAGSTQTAHGVFKGKVAFMAPEQVLGDSVDGRADLFAAGIVLWESLTGKHLMAADSPAKTLHNLMNKKIPRVSELVMDVPAALDEIVAKSLERELDARYSSAKAMRDALEAFIAAEGGISTEEIGDLVSTLFADRKRTVQEQVKGQLAALSLSRTSDPEIHAVSKTHVRARSATVIDLSESASGDSQPSVFRVVTTDAGISPAARATSRLGLTALVFVTSLALGVSGLALYRSQHVTPMATATPQPAMTVTVAAPVTAAPTPSPSAEARAPAPSSAASASSHAAKTSPPPPPAAPAVKPAVWAPRHGAPAPPAVATANVQPAQPGETPKPSPTVSAQPPPQPAETAQGRTFRRDL
jgi:eukaryotic-like serine/threonine-protein kinase